MAAPQKTVLIVDDEQDVIDLVRYNLKRAGYAVVTAMDGIDALAMARQAVPDVIILDLMLPQMDGIAVCAKLKEDKETAKIPVLMLTARGQQEDKIAGLETGADDYVTKPFSPKELVLRIQAVLRRGQQPGSASTLHVGEFLLEKSTMEFVLGGKKMDLTTTEFRLVSILMERRGKILSRETLLHDVWGYRASVDTRTVDTHMRRLRSKLGKHADAIETVRGEGYRFSVL